MTAEEFKIRTRAFRNHTAIVALILFFSFFAVPALFEWLGNTVADVLYLGMLPAIPMLMIAALVYSSRLARKMGLYCPHCGSRTSSSLDLAMLRRDHCRKCGKRLYDEAG
jgi:hypothetical protein